MESSPFEHNKVLIEYDNMEELSFGLTDIGVLSL
jgi:hypothetical protein